MRIGCLECGVSSDLVGVFTHQDKAEAICRTLDHNKDATWLEGGQSAYQVFEIPDNIFINQVKKDYEQYLVAGDVS